MMTPQQVADWYMNRFSDKTPTLGCLVFESSRHGTSRVSFAKNRLHTIYRDNSIYYKENDRQGHDVRKIYTVYYSTISEGFDDYILYEGKYKIIGHPLRRGRLYQELSGVEFKEYYMQIDFQVLLEGKLKGNLLEEKLLDKDIYERVEEPVVMEILIELKEQIERK